MKKLIKRIFAFFGYAISKIDSITLPVECTQNDKEIIRKVSPYTMTSTERLWALISAVQYITDKEIKGDFVECGVWRGGSSMAMAYKLLDIGKPDRIIWLYDTFSGMTMPTDKDIEVSSGKNASILLGKEKKINGNNIWCIASKNEVMCNLYSTNYPQSFFNIVEGDVYKTLDIKKPEK